MSDDWNNRKTLLHIGEAYRATLDAPCPIGPSISAGERLLLKHVGYSHYDNAHVYTFETEGGLQKSFWLNDSDPIERVTDTFAPLEG